MWRVLHPESCAVIYLMNGGILMQACRNGLAPAGQMQWHTTPAVIRTMCPLNYPMAVRIRTCPLLRVQHSGLEGLLQAVLTLVSCLQESAKNNGTWDSATT